MKVHVFFVQNDLTNQETKVITDGIGLLNGHHLLYQEDHTKAKHAVTFSAEEIILERTADVSSRTVLRNGKIGECVVKSVYGEMHFTTRLHSKEMNDDGWRIYYAIFLGQEQVSEMELVWKFEKLA